MKLLLSIAEVNESQDEVGWVSNLQEDHSPRVYGGAEVASKSFVFLLRFSLFYLRERERESEHKQGALSRDPRAGLDPRNLGS